MSVKVKNTNERAIMFAEFIIGTGATVRACASKFEVSKTTVYSDITVKLPNINQELANRVANILSLNMQERHIRSGAATQKKYGKSNRVRKKSSTEKISKRKRNDLSFYQATDESEALIKNNIGLVYFTVNDMRMHKDFDDDYISAGYFGLIKAARTFDVDSGYKFATYAYKCIQNEVLMLYRKYRRELRFISLDEQIYDEPNDDGLTRKDILLDDEPKIDEMYELRDEIALIVNVILNDLTPLYATVLLMCLAGKIQERIGKELNLAQGHVSNIRISP